ncbi:hypothetical protein L0Y69_03440 [bacterium]|nr:hypothetical protein [bacterium]
MYTTLSVEWKEKLRHKKKKDGEQLETTGQKGAGSQAAPAPAPAVLTVQPQKKAGPPKVWVSVLAGAIIAIGTVTLLAIMAWKYPIIHEAVAVPTPLLLCGLVLLGVFRIPRIGPLSALFLGLIGGALYWNNLPLFQQYSVQLWDKLILPTEHYTLLAPWWLHLSLLLIFFLWFTAAKLISRRRTRGIYAIGAAFFIYMEIFILSLHTWKFV